MVAPVETSSTHDTESVRPKVLVEFRKHSGSTLGGFFGAAAFDEVALVPVAAAVDKTGPLRRQLRRSRCAQRIFGPSRHLG